MSILEKALSEHGLSSPKGHPYSFEQKTSVGRIGVFVNPIQHGNEIRFSLRCGIRIDSVQQILEQTELYDIDVSGETWSCGLLLEILARYRKWILPPGSFRARLAAYGLGLRVGDFVGYDDDYMSVSADEGIVRHQVDRLMAEIKVLVLPFFDMYGQTKEGYLDLCMRDDDFADLCWITLDYKIISGLIAARQLGRSDAEECLKAIAIEKGGYFARNGNPDPLARIERVGAALGIF